MHIHNVKYKRPALDDDLEREEGDERVKSVKKHKYEYSLYIKIPFQVYIKDRTSSSSSYMTTFPPFLRTSLMTLYQK